MPISRTPKRTDDDAGDDTIHNPIFDSGHEPETFKEGDGAAPAVKGLTIAELSEQLADMQRQMAETQRANFALMSQAPVQQQNIQQPTKIDLPDPSTDPEGYGKALRAQIEQENDFKARQRDNDQRRDRTLKERVDGLWEDFGDQFPDLAANQDRVDFAAQKVIDKAKKRGIDVEKYMFVTSDKFLADVASQVEAIFAPQGDDDEEDFEPRTRRSNKKSARRSRSRDDEEGSRTTGIFGGQESGGKPSGRRQSDDTGPDMIDDMQAMQKKYGYI